MGPLLTVVAALASWVDQTKGALFELRVVVTPYTPLHRYCGLLWQPLRKIYF